jgi:hypothetical protein
MLSAEGERFEEEADRREAELTRQKREMEVSVVNFLLMTSSDCL